MTEALRDKDVARAVRWLQRSGGLFPVPREAGDLLARRLAARQRIAARLAPWGLTAAALTVALLAWQFARESARADSDVTGFQASERETALLLLGLFVAVAALLAVRVGLAAAADRRIAGSLAHRVQRDRRAPVRVVLGRGRTAIAGLVGVLLGLQVVAVWATQPSWFAAWVSAGLVVVLGCSLLTIRVAVHGPTVADGAMSLAIDERLRSEEAVAATTAPSYCLLILSNLPYQGGWEWLLTVWVVAGVSALIWSLVRQGWRERGPQAWAAPVRELDGSAG